MPGHEANTVNVAKMCSAFAGLGHDVTLIAAANEGAGDLSERIRAHYALKFDIRVLPLAAYAHRPVAAAILGARIAKRIGADLVYTRAPHVALAACMAGLPTILELHTDIGAFSMIGRVAFRRVLAHPSLLGVVVISDALGVYLRQHFPMLQEGRICVAHDGADAHAPQPTRAPLARLAVGYVGHLYPGKGLEIIVPLAALCPWADFYVVGKHGQTTPDAPYNLRFAGVISHAAVPSTLAAFDVVLAPYQRNVIVADGRTDTARWMSPLKVFEYMAAGKAIVASDLAVLREILDQEETALLVAPDAPAEWAAALTRLRDDPPLRRALGLRAQERFLKRHTWQQRAAFILNTLPAKRRRF